MPSKGQLKGKYVHCEWCNKLIYKTPYQLKKHQHYYCSNKCQSEKKHYETYEDRPCEICGRIMHVSKKSTQRFCSNECQKIWQTQQVGEFNPKFTQEKIVCDNCGQEFFAKKYKISNGQKHFCSKACRQAWYANVWSQSSEWKDLSRKRAIDLIKNNQTTTLTKPQIIINKMLEQNEIQYCNEVPFVYYSVDNYLTEYNLIIEVMGDYWHGSPIKFELLNDLQIKNIRRDKAKHTYVYKNYGIEILYLWENDILKRPELCLALVKLYIQQEGHLKNYNSFNYSLQNDELSLNCNIISSYQDMNIEQVKEHEKIAI